VTTEDGVLLREKVHTHRCLPAKIWSLYWKLKDLVT